MSDGRKIKSARLTKPHSPYEVLGWAWAEACARLSKGKDPRNVSMADVLSAFDREFGKAKRANTSVEKFAKSLRGKSLDKIVDEINETIPAKRAKERPFVWVVEVDGKPHELFKTRGQARCWVYNHYIGTVVRYVREEDK